jgi:hypothetical protein
MTKSITSPLVTFRRLTGYALIAAAPFALAEQAAFAQMEPPPQAAVATQSADPPGRVARLNYMAGTVTTEPAGATDWSYASINRPLTTGDQLWNDANARSEMHIGSTAVRLSSSTALDILNLDDSNAQLKVAQGTLSTRVRRLAPGQSYEIDTPNVALGVTAPGDYRVDVAPDGSTTTVTVRRGALTAYGDGGQFPLTAGQQVTFAGTNLEETANDAAPPPDSFDQWADSRDAAEDRSVSARYVSRDMPGYEDLDANGTWNTDPQYGEVWVPNSVPEGWAPYHDGHWVWQAPWGWTWVDDAPWGFAPYHYGRWAYVGSSWCWVPGPLVVEEPPVYAPALVAFVGGGGDGIDWGVNLSFGGGPVAAGVAWFPLGPGEVWHPHWHDRDHDRDHDRGGDWSPRYYQRVNQTVILNRNVDINNIHNTYINYHAPRAVTAVPATAFVHGQPVGRFAQKVDPHQWRNAQISPGAPGIAPVRESFGSGLRAANYRPPQAVAARPVVATRGPVIPAAYHDQLAQRFAHGGGTVPGAGNPVVRTTPPAAFGQSAGPVGSTERQAHGMPGGAPARNLHVVDQHSPVMAPSHAPAPAAQALQGGAHQAPGAPNGIRSEFGQAAPRAPMAAEHQAPGAPNGIRPEFGQAAPHAPTTAERPQPGNGVPRPPMAGVANGLQGEARHEPAWTQPHTPMAQQHSQPNGGMPNGGMPNGGMPNGAAPGREAQQQAMAQPHAPMTQQLAQPGGAAPQQAPRPEYHSQPAQPQPRPEYHPQVAQPQPQPRPEFHPQAAQPQPQPRPEYHPQVAQPQPRPEYHPQVAQPQPRPEYHPQVAQPQPRPEYHPPAPPPQPQPRPEFHPQAAQPQPQPQQQPHAEPHQQPQAHGSHDDQHHPG